MRNLRMQSLASKEAQFVAGTLAPSVRQDAKSISAAGLARESSHLYAHSFLSRVREWKARPLFRSTVCSSVPKAI